MRRERVLKVSYLLPLIALFCVLRRLTLLLPVVMILVRGGAVW